MNPSDAGERLVAIESTLDQQTKLLVSIETQAKLTNGNVRELQLWRARIEGARAAMAWLPMVVTGVVTGGLVTGLAALLS